jgi:hypothetical protein
MSIVIQTRVALGERLKDVLGLVRLLLPDSTGGRPSTIWGCTGGLTVRTA